MDSHRFTRRHRQDGERGQVVVLIVLMLVVLLGMAALVIDVGYAYYTQRALQASADAAALAGAQELPDPAKAKTVALQYSATAGGKNERGDLEDVTTTVTTKCIASIPGCDLSNPGEVNAVAVVEKAPTKTFFAGLLGIDTFKVTVRSTACSPCGVKPLDIMMVLDRTGSMCLTSSGANDPNCTDLKNAQEGMKTFLSFLDPTKQWVGLAVLPPVPSGGTACTAPAHHSTSAANTAYKTYSPYKVVPLSNNYASLISTINCIKGNGYTAYANALEAAQAELNASGRAGVKDVIVFLSDGAANIGPSDLPIANSYRKTPCQQGVNSAATIKGNGTVIYSIGYDLSALGGGANVCQTTSSSGAPGAAEAPAISAYQALQRIASQDACSTPDRRCFYNQPNAGQLKTIFTEIAADLARGTSALIDDNA